MLIHKLLDVFFLIFHTSFILFNLLGWVWKKTRKIHLFCILLTGVSWFGLGWFYGWGYCPFTDWHWQIKSALGTSNLPNSFIKYLLDQITGYNFAPVFVDNLTIAGFVGGLIMAIIFQLKALDKTKHDNHQ